MTWYAGPVATCRFRTGRLPQWHAYPNVRVCGAASLSAQRIDRAGQHTSRDLGLGARRERRLPFLTGLGRAFRGVPANACGGGGPLWPCVSRLCLACPERRATLCPGLAGLFRSCVPSPPAPIAVLCLVCPSLAAWVLGARPRAKNQLAQRFSGIKAPHDERTEA
jgi:hypothetical protein